MTFLERMAETLRIKNEELKKSNNKSQKLWEKLQQKEKDADIKMFGMPFNPAKMDYDLIDN